jgi:hypothetical protein
MVDVEVENGLVVDLCFGIQYSAAPLADTAFRIGDPGYGQLLLG